MSSNAFVNAWLLCVLMATVQNVLAASWTFSYTMNGVSTITGTFDGTLNPDSATISNPHDISISYNERLLSGSPNLFAVGYNIAADAWDLDTPPVISFDRHLNNFLFIDVHDLTSRDVKTTFAMYNPRSGPSDTYIIDYVFAPRAPEGESPINDSWRLAPVPEPETYALFLCGLGVLASFIKRKQVPESRT